MRAPDTRIFSPLAVAGLCVTIGRYWYLFKRLTAVSAGRFYRFEHMHIVLAKLWQSKRTRSAQVLSTQPLKKFLWAAETRTLDPLIKSQGQRRAEPNIDKKANYFEARLAFSSTMEGVCSAQVQAQNRHSRA